MIFFGRDFFEGRTKLKTYKEKAIRYNDGNHEVIEKTIIPVSAIIESVR